MSSDKGYIKLYRDIRDHELWNDKPFARGQAWIDLLLMVNHKDTQVLFDGRLVPVYRGARITSLRKLADRWGWSVGKVARFLDELERDNMIRQERNRKRTMISIVNYEVYQTSRNTERNSDGTLTEHRRNTDGTKQERERMIEERKKNIETPSGEDEDGEPWPADMWEDNADGS